MEDSPPASIAISAVGLRLFPKKKTVPGFDGTSNVLAGKLYGIPIKGTQAHSFISSFSNEQVLIHRELTTADGSKKIDLHEASLQKKDFIMNRVRPRKLFEGLLVSDQVQRET